MIIKYLLTAAILVMTVAQLGAQIRNPASPGDMPNLPQQKIGVDDLLGIAVYDSPELSRTVRVSADGTIRLPLIHQQIQAMGLLPGDLETAIIEALRQEKLLVEPVVTVSVVEYRSRPISVAGAVRRPLTFQAYGQVTLLDALSRAEGMSDDAGPEVLISRVQPGVDGRPTTLVQRIAVKALIDGADAESNIRLEGGEEIRVPEAGKIYVVGNVKKPGAFAVRESTETTVLRMLAVSEGLLPFASKVAYVYRRESSAGGAGNQMEIELEKIMQRKAPDVPLLPNDVLYVPDNKNRRMAITIMDRVATFGAGTASGLLVWRR